MKCEYCHKREADRIFTMACCSKGYSKVAHLDEHFCSVCYDDDETFEMLKKDCTHYPIDNMKYMDKECDQEHEESE
jgi:hypothetical protein